MSLAEGILLAALIGCAFWVLAVIVIPFVYFLFIEKESK